MFIVLYHADGAPSVTILDAQSYSTQQDAEDAMNNFADNCGPNEYLCVVPITAERLTTL